MRVGKVSINNFQTLGEVSLNLDQKGLVLIQGDNKFDTSQNSNGSGKSSIPDAIDWCLFGVTARGVSGDDVVNDRIGKNTSVSIQLIDDAGIHQVTRFRKHKTGKNGLEVMKVEGSVLTDISKGTPKLTQELVNNLVGCSEYVFKSAVYSGQDDMPDLPSMSDKPLKVLIEEAAGIDRIQRATEISARDVLNAKKALEAHTTFMSRLGERLASRERDVLVAATSALSWAESRVLLVTGAKGSVQMTARRAKDLKDKSAAFDPAPVRIEAAVLEAEIGGYREEVRKLNALQEITSLADRAVSLREQNFNEAVIAAKKFKAQADKIEDKIGTACGECGKEYHGEDLEVARETALNSSRERLVQAKQIEVDIKKLKNVADAAMDTVTNFKSKMTDVSKSASRLSELNNLLTSHVSTGRELAMAMESYKKAKAYLEAIEVEDNPHEKQVAAFKEDCESLRTQIEESDNETDMLVEAETMAKEVAKVFGPAGVRAHILDTVTPFLNSRTAQYLSSLSDGNISAMWTTISHLKSGEASEKFTIEVQSSAGAKTYKGLSGGEKRKVKLACAMALQDLVASRASKPIELFMADEIDHALDASGLERLMGVLDEKAKERGTVLVISHNSLSDWIRQAVTVVRGADGIGYMTGEALS